MEASVGATQRSREGAQVDSGLAHTGIMSQKERTRKGGGEGGGHLQDKESSSCVHRDKSFGDGAEKKRISRDIWYFWFT